MDYFTVWVFVYSHSKFTSHTFLQAIVIHRKQWNIKDVKKLTKHVCLKLLEHSIWLIELIKLSSDVFCRLTVQKANVLLRKHQPCKPKVLTVKHRVGSSMIRLSLEVQTSDKIQTVFCVCVCVSARTMVWTHIFCVVFIYFFIGQENQNIRLEWEWRSLINKIPCYSKAHHSFSL